MDIIQTFIDFFLHLDVHLLEAIATYGAWTNALLFGIIFMETGFVVTPFLPGDSILFAAGTFAALGSLNISVLFVLLFVAAVAGDTVNYWIGDKIGRKAFEKNYRFLNKEHLIKTEKFYEKHGGKTIIIARFMPIIRTFAPFVAGVGTMDYKRFISFKVVGGFLWVSLFLFGGFFFGNIPLVRDNFETVIFAIILISVVPMIIEYVRNKPKKAKKEL